MQRDIPAWVRIGLAVLAAPQLFTGAWAILAPQNWFDKFPGADPRLVAAEPPFNTHLATDAGAGFLATGVALAIAFYWPQRISAYVALAAYLAFAVPHLLYHTFNPAPGLTGSEDVTNSILLGASVLFALVLVWGASGRALRSKR